MNGFRRGQKPEDAMGLGPSGIVKDWIIQNNATRASVFTRREGKTIFIDVEGNVVLHDFEIINAEGIKGSFDVEFGVVKGQITILSQLSPEEIYLRIKRLCEMILDYCIGKPHKDQEKYIVDLIPKGQLPLIYRLKAGAIEELESFIRNLPENPAPEEIRNLIEQVSMGRLEFISLCKNESGVDMKQYAGIFNTKTFN